MRGREDEGGVTKGRDKAWSLGQICGQGEGSIITGCRVNLDIGS